MIEARGLEKRYGGTGAVLRGVDIACKKGEIVWVSGPSGSGKTTLLNVIGLLAMPDGGEYTLNGKDVLNTSRVERNRLRREIVSTVFQRGNLFEHLTVEENVSVGLQERDRGRVLDELKNVGLADKETMRAGLLSVGEQQRVAIARAMARRTPVLLADEPIASLDDDNAHQALKLLASVAESGTAVVLVSHDGRASEIATHAYRLKDGQLA